MDGRAAARPAPRRLLRRLLLGADALLFVGGVMNLLWVVALAAIVAVEKLIPHGARLGRVLGIGLLLWGSARIAGF